MYLLCLVNLIAMVCSEFADIFDLEHFKGVLENDVRVVNALPSTHLMTRPVEGSPPLHVTPSWIRQRYLKRVSIYSFCIVLPLNIYLLLSFRLYLASTGLSPKAMPIGV